MKEKTLTKKVNALLEYKNNEYKKKYYILSRLCETNVKNNKAQVEELACLVKSLNNSNGKYPSYDYLYEFSSCVAGSSSASYNSGLINEIKQDLDLRFKSSSSNYESLINEELDSVYYENKNLDSKLEDTILESVKRNINIFESFKSNSGNVVDLTNLFNGDEPSYEQLSSIEGEDESSDDSGEVTKSQIDKTAGRIIDIFGPITGDDPAKVSKAKLADMLGFKGQAKYIPGQKTPVLRAWDNLEMSILRQLSPYGRSKGMSTIAQRKWWIIETIKFCLLVEKQANKALGITDQERDKFSRSLSDAERQEFKSSVSSYRQGRGFGRNLSDEEINQIIDELQSVLTAGRFDLESNSISEDMLMRLLKKASIARPQSIGSFAQTLDIMYPLHDTRPEFEKVPMMSDEEREELRKQNIEFDKRFEDDNDNLEIDPVTGEPLYADEAMISKIKADTNAIDVKEVIEEKSKEPIEMTIKDYREFMEKLKVDMDRLAELNDKATKKINPDIFGEFEVGKGFKEGETKLADYVLPDQTVISSIIPSQDLTPEEIQEIKDIIDNIAKSRNITVIGFDKRGDVYNQLIDKAVSVDEFMAYMKSFDLDTVDQPLKWRDISRSSYGKFRDTAASRQFGVKAWMKELFYSSSANDKAEIYSNAAERWIERLTKLDLIDDKAFTRMKSKTGLDKDDSAIPSKVLADLEAQGKYKRSSKLQDISKTLGVIEKYATNPRFVKRYFDMNREDNLEQVVAEKMASLQNYVESEDEYDNLLSKLEEEDKDVAAYAVLDSMFNGDSGFRIFVTGILKEYYTGVIWPSIEVNLAQAVKKYFDKYYGKGIVAASLSADEGASSVKKEEGKDLFNPIIYLVMERTGIKSTATGVPSVGSSRAQQRAYFLGDADPRGDFSKAVQNFNMKYRAGGKIIKGLDGKIFGKDDVEMLLDDMFSDTGIIGSEYAKLKRLNATTTSDIIGWIQSYPEAKIDQAIILGMALSDVYKKTNVDPLRTDVIELVGKDTAKALKNYKSQYGGLLIGKDFADYLDYEFGFEPVDLSSKGSSNPGGKSFQ